MEIYIKNISVFSVFFLFFSDDLIIYFTFTCITASNTATGDVTN